MKNTHDDLEAKRDEISNLKRTIREVEEDANRYRKDKEAAETNASANYQDTDTDGYTIGIGIEKDLGGVGIRAEITGHEFDDVNANNGKGAGTADANVIDVSEMIGATATISIVKNF